MSEVCILNRSSLSDLDIAYAAEACDYQLREEFCPKWPQVKYTPVRFYTSERDLPVVSDMARLMIVQDTIDFPGALGVHMADPLVRGVVVAQGSRTSVTLSHEVLEMAADPLCSQWVSMGDGRQCAEEVCDPVQADQYEVEVSILGGARKVAVSAFVTPEWFKAGTPGAFKLSPGGYMIVRENGRTHDVWENSHQESAIFARARKVLNSTSRTFQRGVR